MEILRCMEILRSLTKNRLYTKMLRKHLFSIFIIKIPRALNHEDTDKFTLTITCTGYFFHRIFFTVYTDGCIILVTFCLIGQRR